VIERKPLEQGVFTDRATAERYDKEVGKWMRNVSKSFISMAKKWGITEGRVLDVGTGTGLLALEFAKSIPGVKVTGLDLSDTVLELAREKLQKSDTPLKVSFEKGDAEDIPLEDDTFDLVVSSNTLHLIKNPIRMFDEIHRVLKPEGRFIVSDHRRSWLGIFSAHIRASFSPEEVKDLLRRSELQNWAVKDYFLWLSIVSRF
jgi:ubiquinone/menaquinone biosynthesis C-methylase UbiE